MLCLARSMQHVIFPFLGSGHIGQHALFQGNRSELQAFVMATSVSVITYNEKWTIDKLHFT